MENKLYVRVFKNDMDAWNYKEYIATFLFCNGITYPGNNFITRYNNILFSAYKTYLQI